ncbi:phosphopantetheine-binding protein [Streptomyces sp. NPDC093094]|uniref:phosphopantetheine-binding protein n=1 Tax=Streptomyces sp. NPDC093094 TaxID=3366026 RepID=UPI003810A8A7
MPHDSQTLPATASAPPGDLLTELVAMLAAILRLKPEKIDPDHTFRSLGLDSLLTVEFVATVNARYGTAVKADALFDQPTPLAFARHVARERGVPGAAPAETPVRPGPAAASASAVFVPRAETPVQVAPAVSAAPAAPVAQPAPAVRMPQPQAGSAAAGGGAVLDVLREELARILCCDPWDIDTRAAFNLLGVDSILGAEFVATINRIYGLHERAVTLYDHPSLAAMAAHIAAVAPAPPPPAAAVSASGGMDLDALLDAVRDGQLSVDDAVALLPRRG